MISYSDQGISDGRSLWRHIRFQTLPGMISYSDQTEKIFLGLFAVVSNPSRDDFLFWPYVVVAKRYPDNDGGFKPFQGWFPILTQKIPLLSPFEALRFQTLPGMISYSDSVLLVIIFVAALVGFKPFQGWFPILTEIYRRRMSCIRSRFKPFQGWFPILTVLSGLRRRQRGHCFKPFQGWFPILTIDIQTPFNTSVAQFQTLPGMISYSDYHWSAGRIYDQGSVSNPSRDDFLFWRRR